MSFSPRCVDTVAPGTDTSAAADTVVPAQAAKVSPAVDELDNLDVAYKTSNNEMSSVAGADIETALAAMPTDWLAKLHQATQRLNGKQVRDLPINRVPAGNCVMGFPPLTLAEPAQRA